MSYGAKSDYQSDQSARTYEQRSQYRGLVGRRRVAAETNVIGKLVEGIAPGSTVLDCPCGNGRWLAALSARAGRIVARDVSEGMVRAATDRAKGDMVPVDVRLGDAEHLDLEDGAVDYTFSYALMKHLPNEFQARVLREFARVSAKGAICSFAVFKPMSRAWWNFRHPAESYPLTEQELSAMASAAGLTIDRLVKVSQPIVGLEYFAVMSKRVAKG